MQLFHKVSSLFYVYYVRDCLPNENLNKQGIHITTVDTRSNKDTASRHKLAAGRKLATTHLNVSNRQMCGCTGFKSGSYNKSYYNRPFKNDTGL